MLLLCVRSDTVSERMVAMSEVVITSFVILLIAFCVLGVFAVIYAIIIGIRDMIKGSE